MRLFTAIVRSLTAAFIENGLETDLEAEEFYRTYFGNSTVPKDIPIRVRKVLVDQLGYRWNRATPLDNPGLENDELDPADIFDLIADEFCISFPLEEMRQLDGSFDSIVQYVARGRQV